MAINFSDLFKFAPIPNTSKTNDIKKPLNPDISASIKPSVTPPKPPQVDAAKAGSATGGSSSGSKESIALNSGNDVYVWKVPFVLINKFAIDRNNISQLSIFNDEFLPRIKLKLAYKNTYFLYLYLPRKGDRINFVLKSETSSFYDIDEQKTEIRCDFIINNVTVSSHEYGHMDDDNLSIIIDIEGQMFIPELFKKVSHVWKEKTSKDALQEICETLKIGYKTNFDETNDKMNWLCPMDTYYNMIQYIVKHAWIDDKSFFHAYIDLFYNLNFINVNDVLEEKTTKEEEKNIVLETPDMMDFYKRSTELNLTSKVLITNFPTAKTTNYFIENISFKNRLDVATVLNGEGRGIMWYNSDGTESEYKGDVVESQKHRDPFYTNEYDDLHAKVMDNIYQQNFGGLEYQLPEHNVHKNYIKARWNNFQKLQDFHLFEIDCKLRMFNHVIQRSNHLFVLLVTTEMNTLLYLDEYNTFVKNDRTTPEIKLDKVMSGAYYIRGINYHWFNAHENYSQEVLCFRKTKPINPRKIMADRTKGNSSSDSGGSAASSAVATPASPTTGGVTSTPTVSSVESIAPKAPTAPKVPSLPNAPKLLPFSAPKFTPPPLPNFFTLPGLALPSLPALPNLSLPALPTIPGLDAALTGVAGLAAAAEAATLAAAAGALTPAGPALKAAAAAANAALSVAAAAATSVVSTASGVATTVGNAANTVGNAVGDAIETANTVAGLVSTAISTGTDIVNTVNDVSNFVENLPQNVNNTINDIQNTLSGVANDVSNFVNGRDTSIPATPAPSAPTPNGSVTNVQTLPEISQSSETNPSSSNFQNAE